MGHEGVEQMLGDVRDLVDGLGESLLVGLGWLSAATDLAHVLQGRSVHLRRGGSWLEVVKGVNVSAHTNMLGPVPLFRDVDIAQLKNLGSKLQAGSTEIENQRNMLNKVLQGTDWKGPGC
jgi:hypothetical protein